MNESDNGYYAEWMKETMGMYREWMSETMSIMTWMNE